MNGRRRRTVCEKKSGRPLTGLPRAAFNLKPEARGMQP